MENVSATPTRCTKHDPSPYGLPTSFCTGSDACDCVERRAKETERVKTFMRDLASTPMAQRMEFAKAFARTRMIPTP